MKKIALLSLTALIVMTSSFAVETAEANRWGSIIHGERDLDYDNQEIWWPCDKCGGTGRIIIEDYNDYSGYIEEEVECPDCYGTGGYWQ